jgi:hypothetical protein
VIISAEVGPNPDSPGDDVWIYTIQRVYRYPTTGKYYALPNADTWQWTSDQILTENGMAHFRATGESIDVNSIPTEPSIIQVQSLKYDYYDIIQVQKNGGQQIYYLIGVSDIGGESNCLGWYHACEIRKKADGSWGYVLSNDFNGGAYDSPWFYTWNFEQPSTILVGHTNYESLVQVDKFPTVVPITTAVPVTTTTWVPVTTRIPIQIDTPKGPNALPPTPVRTEGPSSNPFYPVNTPIPTDVIVQPTLPVPVAPGIALPTAQPTFRFGKRYAVGDPGSFLGTKYGGGTTTTVTKRSRTVTGSDTVLKPGSRSYGLTPPASGSFVRWYPAARWAAGIK